MGRETCPVKVSGKSFSDFKCCSDWIGTSQNLRQNGWCAKLGNSSQNQQNEKLFPYGISKNSEKYSPLANTNGGPCPHQNEQIISVFNYNDGEGVGVPNNFLHESLFVSLTFVTYYRHIF